MNAQGIERAEILGDWWEDCMQELESWYLDWCQELGHADPVFKPRQDS